MKVEGGDEDETDVKVEEDEEVPLICFAVPLQISKEKSTKKRSLLFTTDCLPRPLMHMQRKVINLLFGIHSYQ